MKYILEIDDSSSTGLHLIGLIKSLLKKEKGITFLSEDQLEEKEDAVLSKMMEEGSKYELADTEKVLSMLRPK